MISDEWTIKLLVDDSRIKDDLSVQKMIKGTKSGLSSPLGEENER